MGPKPTPLFHLESNEEADRSIQVAEDAKAELACLNEGLWEFNQKAEEAKSAKAEWKWEHQRLASKQAENNWQVAAEEKAKKDQQEQLAELAEVNQEVSLRVWLLIF